MIQQKHIRILVTGGAGFIGSALVRLLLEMKHVCVINVDALTYAGDLWFLQQLPQTWQKRHFFHQVNLCDMQALQKVVDQEKPDFVIHLAAETHVDRSIDEPAACVHTNVVGTLNLLEISRQYWYKLSSEQQSNFRFLYVSTDEVYGDLARDAKASIEGNAYRPSSPYAASKASADHLVHAWSQTYGLPVITTHCCNNYGAYQYPEKLIPHMIFNALAGQPLPVYGDGLQQRQWIYVEDHVRALWQILLQGRIGQTYHIGTQEIVTNIELIRLLCQVLEKLHPAKLNNISSYEELITNVADRPGHDRRYEVNSQKLQQELGWQPQVSLQKGLSETVQWYLQNQSWWQHMKSKGYMLTRQGML